MGQPRCRRHWLSARHSVLCDYMYFSRGQTAAAERLMQLGEVVAARRDAWPRPSWAAIMTRAFALVARNHRSLRQVYLPFPWPHLGEYEAAIASVIVNREVDGQDMIFLARLVRPDEQSLTQLEEHLRYYKETPIEQIRDFREALRVARLPAFLRRPLWWLALRVLPRRRARHFGTFGVTTMSPFGARTLEVPTLWTTLLHYGVLKDNGELPVGLAFDHRILDGASIGYALLEMEQILRYQIVEELKTMRRKLVA
jgi:hypothetical protein